MTMTYNVLFLRLIFYSATQHIYRVYMPVSKCS